MACCPNGNECNHIITLGYLKSFIGENVKDSNGSVKHVTSSKGDDYCPTYSELTGGSLIPNFVDGGSGKWSLNVDGITVNGSYQSNQCVMQQDLVLTYTRFDSLTITATPATNIDACSGTSTMSYTYKLKKTVKSMNGSCSVGETSSTDNDTTNVIVYTSNQTWATISKPTVTISKNNPNNNGRSNARVATITGKITYKGENKTATATITQNGLTGSYKFWYSDYTIHGKNVTCNGSSFGCNGGSYSAIAYYYQDDWDVYRWQDKCGVNYNSDTEKRNEKYNTYHEYDRYSGSFSNKAGQCGTWADSKSWAGYGSCSWTQSCNECGDCDPFYEYRTTSAASKSVGCNGGSVSFTANVPYTYHDRHKDESGFCIDNTSEGTSAHTIYVDVESNAGNASSRTITGTKDFISYRITQSAGCTVKSVTSYTDVYAACEGGTNITGETIRTIATTGGCCATSSTTSRVSVTIGDLECNSGATRLIRDAGDYKIYQYGRADCCTEPCKCTDLVVSGDMTIESDANTDIEIGTYTAGCVTDIAASESADWVTSITASGGSIKATVTENTSTENTRTTTITVTGKAGSDTCTKTFTLTQKAKATACTCDDLTVTGLGDKIPAIEEIRLKIGSYTAACVTNITATSSDSWIKDITSENGDFVAFVEGNTSETSERTATISVTAKAGDTTCLAKTFTVTQLVKPVTRCFKGTDNGIDVYPDAPPRDRKIFLCGGGDATTEIGRLDSIYVPGYELQWSKNGSTWTDLPVYPATSQIESWVKISRQGTYVFTQGEPYSSGSSERSTQIQFRAKYYPASSATTQGNVPLCETWGYHIVQCPVGYYWAGTHAYNVIMAKCGSDPSLYPNYGCQCSEPTDCTYTVNSNVEGAIVTWSGGTMGTTKTTTIVDGTSSINIPCAGTIRATLTKEGCTFDDTDVKVYEGETVTINGTCSGPTPTCTCTATPTSTPLSSGVTSDVVVGSYSRSGDCPGEYSATKTSGADFLSITAFTGSAIRGNIISANTTSSARTATYIIKRGDTVCNNNFVVTQAAGSPTPTTCTCSSSNLSVTGVNVSSSGGNAVFIANFTSECDPSLSFENYAGDTFIDYSRVSYTYTGSTKEGKIYATVPQNTASSSRTEQVGVSINGETDFCKHFTVTQSGATSTCTCNSINITQQSVSFDHNSGSTKVGTIEQGCTLNVLSTSDWASLTQNGTDIVASVKENTTSSGRGTGLAYNIVGFTANTCGTVVFTQSGAPTTYNISIYGEQAETASGVKVYLAYTTSSGLPSDAHFQFEDGCTLRIKYGNCNGSTEYPIVPNNYVVPNCTPGSGQEYAIESGTRVQMETLSVNFSLFGETHHLTSGGSGTYTNQGNTYIVTVQ